MALSMIMGKKTPISAFSECLNLAMRVRKMLQERAKACGMDEVQFFSKLRHRYCLMAELNFSLVRNTSPLFSSKIISSSNASTYAIATSCGQHVWDQIPARCCSCSCRASCNHVGAV